MRDLAFLALLVLMLTIAGGIYFGAALLTRHRRHVRDHARWRIVETSINGVTSVSLALFVEQSVLERREVGQVRDDDPDYDEKLLTLRAKAQQRQAVV